MGGSRLTASFTHDRPPFTALRQRPLAVIALNRSRSAAAGKDAGRRRRTDCRIDPQRPSNHLESRPDLEVACAPLPLATSICMAEATRGGCQGNPRQPARPGYRRSTSRWSLARRCQHRRAVCHRGRGTPQGTQFTVSAICSRSSGGMRFSFLATDMLMTTANFFIRSTGKEPALTPPTRIFSACCPASRPTSA